MNRTKRHGRTIPELGACCLHENDHPSRSGGIQLHLASAGAKGITLSAAISELIYRAELGPEQGSERSRLLMNEHGYLEIAETGTALTPAMVKQASEDDLV